MRLAAGGRSSRQALEDAAKRLGRRAGIEIQRYRPAAARRARFLREAGVDVVLDIGANVGQYAQELRAQGFTGAIHSFEPLDHAYSVLAEKAARDPFWRCYQMAISDVDGRACLNVSANLVSSSLLPMDKRHLQAAPYSRYVGTQQVAVARLDSINLLVDEQTTLMLKADVQGNELRVLVGAGTTLSRTAAVELEMSVIPLYKDQPVLREIVEALHNLGFELIMLEPAFHDPTSGQILAFDGLFQRRDATQR